MKSIRTDQYEVDWSDTDVNGRAKISAICNYLQLSAGNHAIELGFGFDDVLKLNQIWVIIGLMVKMQRFPNWREKISVDTWAKGIDRFLAFRDFRIRDKNNEVIGAASSTWMILNLSTRRPVKVDIVKPVLELALPEQALGQNPPLIEAPDKLSQKYVHHTQFSEIDHNGHVNNTRYIDWAMDAFSMDHHTRFAIDSMIVNFQSEAHIDEQIGIAADKWDGSSNIIQGTRLDNNKAVFRAKLNWNPLQD